MLKFKIKFEKPKYCFVVFSLVYRASSFCFTIPTFFPECHFSSNTGMAVGPVSHLTQTQDNASSQAHSSGFNCNLEQRFLGNNLVQLNNIYVRMQVNKFYLVLCFSVSLEATFLPTAFYTSQESLARQIPLLCSTLYSCGCLNRKG